jgi:hypothetical protein
MELKRSERSKKSAECWRKEVKKVKEVLSAE